MYNLQCFKIVLLLPYKHNQALTEIKNHSQKTQTHEKKDTSQVAPNTNNYPQAQWRNFPQAHPRTCLSTCPRTLKNFFTNSHKSSLLLNPSTAAVASDYLEDSPLQCPETETPSEAADLSPNYFWYFNSSQTKWLFISTSSDLVLFPFTIGHHKYHKDGRMETHTSLEWQDQLLFYFPTGTCDFILIRSELPSSII